MDFYSPIKSVTFLKSNKVWKEKGKNQDFNFL